MRNTTKITYSAFGRHFNTETEATTYGLNLMADTTQWVGTTPPNSFKLFHHATNEATNSHAYGTLAVIEAR